MSSIKVMFIVKLLPIFTSFGDSLRYLNATCLNCLNISKDLGCDCSPILNTDEVFSIGFSKYIGLKNTANPRGENATPHKQGNGTFSEDISFSSSITTDSSCSFNLLEGYCPTYSIISLIHLLPRR
eukprot:NODE_71_length_23666_cov_0.239403.p13 type:complete len:126 gc:universal NODE_71_length_23666_cov_0.239403:10561-10938(+)